MTRYSTVSSKHKKDSTMVKRSYYHPVALVERTSSKTNMESQQPFSNQLTKSRMRQITREAEEGRLAVPLLERVSGAESHRSESVPLTSSIITDLVESLPPLS